MATLCLNRFGNVCTQRASNNQCKIKGQHEYNYHVKILVPATNLNAKTKFIMDHKFIHETITKLFARTISSCEEMTIQMANHLKKLMLKKRIYFTDIYIKLQPINKPDEPVLAFMEYFENSPA